MKAIPALRFAQFRRQRGAALAVALIMLVMISLLAAAGFLLSTTEARGAVNWSDRQRAMFVAEGALKEAEAAVKTVAASANVEQAVSNKGQGYFIRSEGRVPPMNPWPSGNAINATSKDSRLEAGSAQYIVVYEGKAAPSGMGEVGANGSSVKSGQKPRFTIYAKAGGIREGTHVVLSYSNEF